MGGDIKLLVLHVNRPAHRRSYGAALGLPASRALSASLFQVVECHQAVLLFLSERQYLLHADIFAERLWEDRTVDHQQALFESLTKPGG